MKILLVLSAVLAFTAAAEVFQPDSKNWVDYRLNAGYAAPDPEECVAPGFICGGCKDYYYCTNVGGTWEVKPLGECQGSQTCNNGQCVDTPNSECALEGKNFECVSLEGMYPDPGSCKTFYYCVPDGNNIEKIESSCSGNYGYNVRTTYCDVTLANGNCPASSVPICTKPGQTAALAANPTMYYICEPYDTTNELYPNLYTCPNGRSYNGNFSCK